MQLLPKAVAGIAAAGAACFGWGLLERGMYTVRRASVDLLPPGSEPVRILHISDLHVTTRRKRQLAFIESLADLKPDLIVNTGDNISQAAAIEPLMDALSGLRDVPGVFVFGSNDYYAPHFRNPLRYLVDGKSTGGSDQPEDLPTAELESRFREFGWLNLTQRRATVEVRGHRFAFRGTDDAHLSRDDYSQVAGRDDPSADVSVGVTHAPYLRLLDAMASDRMGLIFAGHTHGGQVCLPGYGALITNCDLDTGRVKGLSSHHADGHTSRLHVSAGLGTSPFAPYRFACRPEVTLLTLESSAAAA